MSRNGVESNFFITGKGLRQGDPISPLLFNLVMDIFSKMLTKGSQAGLIRGLCPELVRGGVMCLQYADDTLLFLENDTRVALNLKWILTCFEQISGMRINYHKSALVPINLNVDDLNPFVEIFQCMVGDFPIKYLGVPLHFDKLSREDLQELIDKILARIVGWRGKLLSYLGKITLIRTYLASIPLYLLSFFKFPKWALNLINSHMANCLWSDSEGASKI